MKNNCWLPLLVLALCCPALQARNPSVSAGGLQVSYHSPTGAVRVSDAEFGPVLTDGVLTARVGGREVSTAQTDRVEVRGEEKTLTLRHRDGLTVRIALSDEAEMSVRAEGEIEGPVLLEASAAGAARWMPAVLKHRKAAADGVLTTVLGPAEVPGTCSVFDPERDLAVTTGPPGRVRWERDDGWKLHAQTAPDETALRVAVRRNYYRDELGIEHYAPIRKRPRWKTAPVVAMTWYGIEGWKGDPAQTREWLYPQIEWVAKNLLPYAETLVFQLDDNYPKGDDEYMRDVSDFIRSHGLVPGIWFTPFTVAPPEVYEEHPEWFLHGPDGKPLKTFGGVSYGRSNYTLNVSRPAAVEAWYGRWWRKAGETWNFEFFKIDGQPQVINAYRKAADAGGVQDYRRGLRMGREIVGPEKFINGCWGIPLAGIGIMDGARTGGDTGNNLHAIDVVLRWNFLNNVCWWSDPDAAANLHRATVERARLNAQARVLTGQQFLTDDVWTKVPDDICRVWQRSFPTLNIRPVNLYRIENWRQYDLFDLRIAGPGGTRDVVGLFNYDAAPTEKTLDLSKLPLDAERVHVYEFWSGAYLGAFRSDAQIERRLKACEGQLFSVVRASSDRPVLVSTGRHLSQGGLDLEELAWERDGLSRLVRGKSSHLVAGDPYELVFAPGPWEVTSAESPAGDVSVEAGGGVARVRVVPDESGSARWTVRFGRIDGARLDLLPAMLPVPADGEASLTLLSRGDEPVRWRARPSDPRISVTPSRGKLGPHPARSEVRVLVDTSGLQPAGTWTGQVKVEAAGRSGRSELLVRVPPPPNLALRAEAGASSAWSGDYTADRANDGDPGTRWNSKRGDESGCWLELAWQRPVTLDRVVIDEVTTWGLRIRAWRLQAGDELKTVARGETVGQQKVVTLEEPLTTKRLRLTIDEASETPTIRELEVYRWKARAGNPEGRTEK